MNIRILSVLMWKHTLVRSRSFMHTAVDCVIPLIFFILLFASKDHLRTPVASTQYRDPVANTDIIRLEGELIPPPYWIMYYPETMLTNSLMGEVGAKLNLQQLNSTSERAYFPLSDLSQLPDVAAKMQITEAVIIFQDMTGETWPNHLNYTIRMKVDFKTGTYLSLDDTRGPYRMFGFKYSTFMRIQWAVDTSYIKLVTGDEVPQVLSLQEFPYYYRRLDASSVLICKLLIPVCWLSLLLTFVSLMVRRLNERASGIQELMKMLGVSSRILGLSHFLNVQPCALIFSIGGTILLKSTSNPLIQHSSGFLIFLMLLLYFNSVVSLAFICSYVPPGTQYAASLSEMAYILLWMPTRVSKSYKVRLLAGFLPHTPMYWFWTELGVLEMYEEGSSFSNIAKTHAENNNCVLLSYIYLFLQAFVGYFVAWYLSNVRPGQYGQALPWYFIFQRKPKSNEKEKIDKKLSEDYKTTEYGSSDLSFQRKHKTKEKEKFDKKLSGDYETTEYGSSDLSFQRKPKTKEKEKFDKKLSGDYETTEYGSSDLSFQRKPKSNKKEKFDQKLSEDYETTEYGSSDLSTVRTVTYEPKKVPLESCRLSDDSNWCYSSDTDDRKPNKKDNYDKELSEDYETSEYSTDRTVTYELRRVPQGFCRLSDDSNWCYSSDTDDAKYWTKEKVEPHAGSDEEDPMTDDSFFDPPPADAKPRIKGVNIIKAKHWTKKKVVSHAAPYEEDPTTDDSRFFELPQADAKPGIKSVNLFKAKHWTKDKVEPHAAPDEEDPTTDDSRFIVPPPADAKPGIKGLNIFKASYWTKEKVESHAAPDEDDPLTDDSGLFEPPPEDAKPGIKGLNIFKASYWTKDKAAPDEEDPLTDDSGLFEPPPGDAKPGIKGLNIFKASYWTKDKAAPDEGGTMTDSSRLFEQPPGDAKPRFKGLNIFKASYWTKDNLESDEEEDSMSVDSLFFEPPPADAEPGIKVVNVSKAYPLHRALKNVSLEVYKGEITVLLGHNGAGKTTLMSIITGMISATEGKVFIHGKDTVTQRDEVRKHLGLCPQHNLFIEDLTVREHIMFFTLLKQGTYAEARKSASRIAERLTLSDKLNSLPSQLSGGMKRRVQIACALTGGADVLVLDEPTSGLDVETRRELWDLLLSLRSERTVLLTTHFMEEADALGDRVAALHAGVLRCFATTMYLKKAVGSGYRLVLSTFRAPKEHEITKVVRSNVPGALLKELTFNSITYSLPAAQTGKFPGLFSVLEAKKPKLGIDSIGVGVSSLEEVFLKLCSDTDTTLFEDEEAHDRKLEEANWQEKITGVHLCMRQLYVLLKRHVKFILHKKWVYLVMHIILPIFMISYMTYSMNGTDEEENPDTRAMNLDLYGDQPDRRVMYHLNGPVVRLPDVTTAWKRYPQFAFQDADDVATALLRTGQKDILEYNKYLVGVEINETDAKILYTTVVRHAAPVALNLLSNMLAAQHMPWADGRTITTMNDPVNRELGQPKPPAPPKDISMAFVWGLFISFLILAANVNNVALPCKDRMTTSRHIHVMSGCPPELHWLITLGFHGTTSALTLVLPVVLAVLIFERNETTNQPDMLATFALVLLLGSLSFSVYSYLVSFNFGERGISVFLVASIFIFAVFTPLMKKALEFIEMDSGMLYQLLLFCKYIGPPHTMVDGVFKCLSVARLNAKCKYVRSRCPGIYSEPGLDAEKCCAGEKPRCYLCWDEFSPAKNIVILLVQILVMLALVFLTERGVFDGMLDKVMNMNYRPENHVVQDKMVRVESAYVSNTITLPPNQIPDALLVHDLHKNYRPFCRKSVNAVRGISFSVKKGECFGLLGVNGAGKSSTFKMLTLEESATRGRIFGNGYHLKRGNSHYLQTLGYCPQFFGLDTFLTGEENLELILTLRGFDKERVEEEVRNWIHIVGLEKYAQRPVEGYSGGCVRRLGTAVALCGGAELALLDEPSAGVDVAARRQLWIALRRVLRQRRAIIITSHSMEEMEALCARIAILAAGRVTVLGTAAELRAAGSLGHAVVLKLARKKLVGTDELGVTETEIKQLKKKLQRTFNCTLKDEHKTMLHYHINQIMPYSKLFTALESLRSKFPYLIEDYSVTETTLEEVFLSLAKKQQTEAQNV